MRYIADLHLHSKYSRAVSPQMTLPIMNEWAKKKGLQIIATSDFTHPMWFRHIQDQLEESEPGLFKIRNTEDETRFLLSVEISSIYSQNGRTRRIHSLVWAPSLETVEKINKELLKRGCNLGSDGRPIIGLSAQHLLELILSIDNTALVIPAHVWTPWFALYGSMSGFDSLEEAFGPYSKHIFAVETGLSSDPEMNWKIKELDKRSIVSFSDAHSMAKMGREATAFELEKLSFQNIRRAIVGPNIKPNWQSLPDKIAYTIEFYPEEGKYHFTGHRNCGVSHSPEDTKKYGDICPVCKKGLTVGVMHRVEDLAIQEAKVSIQNDDKGIKWIHDKTGNHPPYIKLVPLNEIVAESISSTVSSQKVKDIYNALCFSLGPEIDILLNKSIEKIAKDARLTGLGQEGGDRLAEGISKVRSGDIVIKPGFDGEYGIVKIWDESNSETEEDARNKAKNQLGIDF
ncbi:endonuclease Q family protein [Patescibacteria group bacterium]|nr:endonuclease Q family protein [Patescibacteria group bacterium]